MDPHVAKITTRALVLKVIVAACMLKLMRSSSCVLLTVHRSCYSRRAVRAVDALDSLSTAVLLAA